MFTFNSFEKLSFEKNYTIMFDFSEATLETCSIHGVGNIGKEEPLYLSEESLHVEEAFTGEILLKYFTHSFKREQYYHFSQEENTVFQQIRAVFENNDELLKASQLLAQHLHENSLHPRIKGGEFFMAKLNGCKVDGRTVSAIGLFKSENKDVFLKVFPKSKGYGAGGDNGININKLDKGCLVFNMEKDEGYKVLVVDNANFGEEAKFWKEDFLKVKPAADDYNITANFMKLTKGFCEDVLTEEHQIDKKDQLIIKNKALDYFKNNETFNTKDFAAQVIEEPQVIEAFHQYKQNFFRKHDMEPVDEVEISDQAVKNSGRFLKSVLKLDKNFHVYVHGRHDFIEKGFDEEKDMHYYRLFFKNEQ